MRTRIARIGDLTDADWDRWGRLAHRAVEPNGWLDPVFVRPAARWPAMADDLLIALTEDDEDLRGVLAFTVSRQRRLPLTLLTTEGRFMTWHADRHHPLVDPDCTDDALGALLTGIGTSGLGHLIEISLFPADGPLADALTRLADAGAVGVTEVDTVASVHAAMASSGDNPADRGVQGLLEGIVRGATSLKADHRRKLWSKARAFESHAGTPLELEDWSTREDVADRFIALQSQGWKGDEARGGAGFSTDPAYEQWFRDVVTQAQERSTLVAVALTAADRLVALNLALVSGSACSGFVDCYDEEFRGYGPGTLARVATWRWALQTRDVVLFDPALNDPRIENARLYPDAREFRHLVIGAGGRGKVMLGRRWGAVGRAKSRWHRSDIDE